MTTTTKIENPDPLLTIEEAADYLRTTERWMRRSIDENRIPRTKVGRLVRFRQSALDAYLDANTVASED